MYLDSDFNPCHSASILNYREVRCPLVGGSAKGGSTVPTCTVRVENFVQFKILSLSYLENFAGGSNSTFVYNFRVISHPRKTRN